MIYLLLGIVIGGAAVWFLRARLLGAGVPDAPTAPTPPARLAAGDPDLKTIPPPPSSGAVEVPAPTTPAPRENVVEGVAGDVKGKSFVVGRRIVTIGRSPANYIQTMDSAASRVHCQLRVDAAGLWLTDMTSSNGTLVNGKRVTGKVQVHDGDLVTIGAAMFRYRAGAVVEDDAALRPKRADPAAKAATAPAAGGDRPLHALVYAALEATHGDIEKAAAALEVDVHTVVEILDERPR